MRVINRKENMLSKIKMNEVFDSNNPNTEKEQAALIHYAAQEFHEALDDERHKNMGVLTDEIYEEVLNEISGYASEILSENIIPMKFNTLRAKISIRESEINDE